MVYARTVGERVYSFEPSGGLIDGALVMNDFETGSYWYLMNHTAVAGPARGQRLRVLPVAEKTTWREWVAAHPQTKVLSVGGVEDVPVDPYANYFASPRGFRGLSGADDRLPAKEPIFAWASGGKSWCVPCKAFAGRARLLRAGDEEVLLFRPARASVYRSSGAWRGRFRREGARVRCLDTSALFDPQSGRWEGKEPTRLDGFDTFWVSWSLAHPDTQVLGRPRRRSF